MEKSIFELAVEELLERQHLTKLELRKRFKGVKPFRMERVSDADLLYDYNTRGFEHFTQLANTQSLEQAVEYRDRMEALKQKREQRRER